MNLVLDQCGAPKLELGNQCVRRMTQLEFRHPLQIIIKQVTYKDVPSTATQLFVTTSQRFRVITLVIHLAALAPVNQIVYLKLW